MVGAKNGKAFEKELPFSSGLDYLLRQAEQQERPIKDTASGAFLGADERVVRYWLYHSHYHQEEVKRVGHALPRVQASWFRFVERAHHQPEVQRKLLLDQAKEQVASLGIDPKKPRPRYGVGGPSRRLLIGQREPETLTASAFSEEIFVLRVANDEDPLALPGADDETEALGAGLDGEEGDGAVIVPARGHLARELPEVEDRRLSQLPHCHLAERWADVAGSELGCLRRIGGYDQPPPESLAICAFRWAASDLTSSAASSRPSKSTSSTRRRKPRRMR